MENGKFSLNVKPAKRKPVRDYLHAQGRFDHLSDFDIEKIQKKTDAKLEAL